MQLRKNIGIHEILWVVWIRALFKNTAEEQKNVRTLKIHRKSNKMKTSNNYMSILTHFKATGYDHFPMLLRHS